MHPDTPEREHDDIRDVERIHDAGESLAEALRSCLASVEAARGVLGSVALPLPDDREMGKLERCVREYAALERKSGAPPEQVVVRVKQLVLTIVRDRDYAPLLTAAAVGWSIDAYFDAT